jgi:DNA-binding transcriptional regulator LsrR (DeoR family)
MLLAQEGLKEVLDRARAADIAVVSMGLLGTFLDALGRPVDHPLNRRAVGLPPEDLKRLPTDVLTSGGAEKAAMMRAVLLGGYVNALITDERTAERLAVAG